MLRLPYLHYDVFTRTALLGNQLAVFTGPDTVDQGQMQAIAQEMNFSESTFILPAESTDTDVRMRIFTPRNEMPMAGHPTIGSTFALAEIGVIAPGTATFVFGLNVGPTLVELEWRNDRLDFAWMTQPLPQFASPDTDRAAAATALGLDIQDLAGDLPVQEVSCGVPFLFVPLRDPAAVDRAVSERGAFRRLSASRGVERPVFLFAVTGREETVYSRMFAPEFGISEDPATGGASGPLGAYLVHHGVVRGDAMREIVSRQGVAMGRASRVHIAIDGTRERITSVKIGGAAILVGRGELLL